MEIVTVQSVSVYRERQAGAAAAGGVGWGVVGAESTRQGMGQHRERGGYFKGLSSVSNFRQRDYTMLSSLFNLRLKRELFVSLVSHCFSVCHSTTSGLQGKYGSCIR